MKVLITGAGGFLGRAVTERMLAHGYSDLRCLCRREPERSEWDMLQARYPAATIEPMVGNLLSRADAARAAEGADLILHLAAASRGAAADLFLNTVVGSQRLLDCLGANRAARVVLVSSFGVYGSGSLSRATVINEETPLETRPELRDGYSYAKWRQERLFLEYRDRCGLSLTVLRPGIIYGPGGVAFSRRIGITMPGIFLHVGGSNLLPLSYVDNCAEAVALAASKPETAGETYNVHDDDLPTAREYLRGYKRSVKKLRSVYVPYPAMMLISSVFEFYHRHSQGQLPAVFTRYGSATLWKGWRFDNSKLKGLGWRQLVPTPEGLRRAFESFRLRG